MFCWRGLKPGAIVAAALALRRALGGGKAESDSRAGAEGGAAAIRAEPGR